MTLEAQIKSVALFFSLALLDDQLAGQATVATLYRLKKKLEKEKSLAGLQTQAHMVALMNKFWLRYCKYLPKDEISNEEFSLLRNDFVDVGPWREFRRLADENEFLAVLWTQVLGFDDAIVAQGLNTTSGTVRHRVSRGLRYLGERMI